MKRGIRISVAVMIPAVLLLWRLHQDQLARARPTHQSAAQQTDPQLQSLIQALDVPEKQIAALESLRTYKGPRELAIPPLTKILEEFDIGERVSVLAAEIISAFDSSNRDAAL